VASIKRSFLLSILSLVVVAALALTAFYWYVARDTVIEDAEQETEVWVGEFARAHAAEMIKLLGAKGAAESSDAKNRLPAPLAAAIAELMKGGDVVKVEIIDRTGSLAYESDPNLRRTGYVMGTSLRAALKGRTVSHFIYKGEFDPTDLATARESIVRCYVPIEVDGEAGIDGVVVVETNVERTIALLARARWHVLLGSMIGFVLLAVAQFIVARRTGQVIDSARRAVESDRRDLTRASFNVLRSEEASREKIAEGLDTGVVQTLSAVKLLVEDTIVKAYAGELKAEDAELHSVVPAIREVIESLSALAAELRPASLPHLGLLPALERMCEDFRAAHGPGSLAWAADVEEGEVPEHLRLSVYRTVQAVLGFAVRDNGHHHRVDARLAHKGRDLELRVDLRGARAPADATPPPKEGGSGRVWMEQVAARVILSGGNFSLDAQGGERTRILALWPLGALQPAPAEGKPVS
jgi:signal transduction histidine kinase